MDLRQDHFRVLKAIFAASGFILIARMFGAAKEIAIAARYGIDAVVDAYVFDVVLVNWPVSVAMSILTATLMPILVRNAGDPAGNRLFSRQFAGLMIVVGVIVGVAAAALVTVLVSTETIGFDAAARGHVLSMIWPLSVIVPLGMVSVVYACILMAEGRHINSLIEGIPALVLAGCVVISPVASGTVLVAGTVFGVTLQLVLLLTAQHRGSVGWPRPGFTSPLWRVIGSAILVMGVGQAIAALVEVVDQLTAASLGLGANATLGYATRVLGLLLGLGGLAIVRAVLPIFSDLAGRDPERRNRLSLQWMLIMFAVGVLGTAICWPLAEFGIRILFQRGAFTAADTEAVAELFRFGLLQLPAYFAFIVIVQRIVSERRYILFVYQAVLTVLVKIALNILMTNLFGLKGIMLSTSLTAFFTLVILAVLSRSRLGFPDAAHERS